MSSVTENIGICIETRRQAAKIVAETLSAAAGGTTEVGLRDQLQGAMAQQPEIHDEGWYNPPPKGIGVLFADSSDIRRSQFPTLRTEPFWPSEKSSLSEETVGMVYLSPVQRASGIIGDVGLTFYRGTNPKIQEHLAHCLGTVEEIAEQAEVGMAFQELHALGQNILAKSGLHNGWMVTYKDPLHGPNFGHTMPWTNELPTPDERAIIEHGDIGQLSELISNKRLFVNSIETTAIPESVAFGIEARMGLESQPDLPGGYYYALITFKAGQRQIFTYYNTIFEALGIRYMRSKY